MMAPTENDTQAGTIWAMNLDWPRPSIQPGIPVAFQRVEGDSLRMLAGTLDESILDEFKDRLGSGRRCYAACAGSQLAAYGWVSFEEESIGELNLRVHLLAGEAYIWDCVTLPAFRGQRLYTALLVYITAELWAENFCRAWIGADLDNIPSQRGIASAGFRAVADLVLTRVVALRRVWAQGRPGIPENLVAEARRVFLGDRDKVWLNALTSAMHG